MPSSVVTDLFIAGYKSSGLGGAIARAYLAIHPVLALAALLFAIIGRVARCDHRARRPRPRDLAQ